VRSAGFVMRSIGGLSIVMGSRFGRGSSRARRACCEGLGLGMSSECILDKLEWETA
jgi:hypothetical protein